MVHIVAAGACTIRADQAGDGTYTAAPPVDRSFTIAGTNATVPPSDTLAPPGAQGERRTIPVPVRILFLGTGNGFLLLLNLRRRRHDTRLGRPPSE
jgi:hypothetical protein